MQALQRCASAFLRMMLRLRAEGWLADTPDLMLPDSRQPVPHPATQELRTTLDQKMMHNVNTAVQQADALLVIVDSTSNLGEVTDMPGMAPGWTGPPAALVRPLQLQSRLGSFTFYQRVTRSLFLEAHEEHS